MDQVAICNLALGWLGANPITSIDDASVTAELCKANWDAVRDVVLEAREWTFAIKRASLAADATAPEYYWGLRYQLPSTCVRVLDADDGSGYADFEWVKEGQYILTNQAAPLRIRYVERVEDTALWSAGFGMAMAYRLAFAICIALTENRSQQNDLWALFQKSLTEAARMDGMQGRSEHVRVGALHQRRW
jgi:hypothetical protein